VSATAVVAIFDPVADRKTSTLLRGPHAPVVELGLQGCEERLGHRVVPAHPGVAHGASEPVGVTERGDLLGGVLTGFNRWKQHPLVESTVDVHSAPRQEFSIREFFSVEC
jgi:hypothetical protein